MRISSRGHNRPNNRTPNEYFNGDSTLISAWPLMDGGMDFVGAKHFAMTNVSFTTDGAYFNGTSSFGVTPSIDLTGTNKVTLIADVKIHDYNLTAARALFEFSVDATLNAGSFFVFTQGNVADDPMRVFTLGNVGTNSAYYFPSNTNLIDKNRHLMCFAYDYTQPGALAGEVSYTQDGILMSKTALNNNNNTGNFGNYALYIGARSGTSLFSNISVKNMALLTRILSSEEIADYYAWSRDVRPDRYI